MLEALSLPSPPRRPEDDSEELGRTTAIVMLASCLNPRFVLEVGADEAEPRTFNTTEISGDLPRATARQQRLSLIEIK